MKTVNAVFALSLTTAVGCGAVLDEAAIIPTINPTTGCAVDAHNPTGQKEVWHFTTYLCSTEFGCIETGTQQLWACLYTEAAMRAERLYCQGIQSAVKDVGVVTVTGSRTSIAEMRDTLHGKRLARFICGEAVFRKFYP